MSNTTTEMELIEVTTELTISDVRILCDMITGCLDKKIFAAEGTEIVKDIHKKLIKLLRVLENT
jgi:hypothetical protein